MRSSKPKLSLKEKIKKPAPISILSYQPNNFFVKIYTNKITLNYLNKNNNGKTFENIQGRKLQPKITIKSQNTVSSSNTHIFPENSIEINSSSSNNISHNDCYLHNKELYSFSFSKQKNLKKNSFRNYKLNSHNINKSFNIDIVKFNNNRNKFRKNAVNSSFNKNYLPRKNNKKFSHVSIIDSDTIDTIKTYPKNLTIDYSISNNDINHKINLFKLQKINTSKGKTIQGKMNNISSTKLNKEKNSNKKMKFHFESSLVPKKYNIHKLYKKIQSNKKENLFNTLHNKITPKNYSMILNDSIEKINKKTIKNDSFRGSINNPNQIYSYNKFYNIFNKFQNSSLNKSTKIKGITMIKKKSVKINLFSNDSNNREKSINNKTKKISKNKNYQKELKKKFARKINIFSLIQKKSKKKNKKKTKEEKINNKINENDFFMIDFILNESSNNQKEVDKFDDMDEIIKKINYEQEKRNEINIFNISNENILYNKYKEKFDKKFEINIKRKKKYNSANLNKIKYKKDFHKIVEKAITKKFSSKLYKK